MALTLTEASKLIQNPLQRGVVEIFPQTSPVLEKLPFLNVNGNAYSYNIEQTLPGIAFRNYNATYTESTGVVNPKTEKLYILGGISAVDRALVKTQGNVNDLRAIQDSMKAKAAALTFTKTFFKGNTTTNSLEFDGLENRLTGAQVIDAAGALTLDLLDALIDAVQGEPDILFMSKAMRRNVNNLMRKANQAQEMIADSFGRMIPAYGGIPIGIIECDKDGNEILTNDIYACRFGAGEWVSGLQAGDMEVIDQGLTETSYKTLIEWICGMAVFNPKAAARLKGIVTETGGTKPPAGGNNNETNNNDDDN